MRDDLFEDVAHLEIVRVALIVIDVAAGQGRFVEVPDEALLVERERREPVRVELHHGRIVHALEEVFAIRRRGRRRRHGRPRRIRDRRIAVRAARRCCDQCHCYQCSSQKPGGHGSHCRPRMAEDGHG